MKLQISPQRIERVAFDYAATVLFSGGTELHIETEFRIFVQGADPVLVRLEYVEHQEIHRAMLTGRIVESAEVDEMTGMLEIAFRGSAGLSVAPDANFEAWSLTEPNGSLMVALPGGGIARWEPRE